MKLITIFLAISTILITSSPLAAQSFSGKQWFAAATSGTVDGGVLGSTSGDGSIAHPWEIQQALHGANGSILPGDTLWLRGGTYRSPSVPDSITSKIFGTLASPILVRNYNRERAIIDGASTSFTLFIQSEYTWYWGLEFIDSSGKRNSHTCDRNTSGVGTYCYNEIAFGPSVYADTNQYTDQYGEAHIDITREHPGNRFINNLVHDTAQGFSAYNGTPDTEYSGNVVYYNGTYAEDRQHGHGIYQQNSSGHKYLYDNLVFNNADEGLQIYGSGASSVIGFLIEGNTAFNNSSWPGLTYQYNYLVSGGGVRKDIVLRNNLSYFPTNSQYGQDAFGQYTLGDDMSLTDSVFVGGSTVVGVEKQKLFTFTGNTLVAGPLANYIIANIANDPSFVTSGYIWDNNTYYNQSLYGFRKGYWYHDPVSGNDIVQATGYTSPAAWQAATGFDMNSVFSNSAPTGQWIYVRPNRYETKRANITIFNWDNFPSVNVNIGSLLQAGDPYEVRDVQNFFGPAVASGTYGGGGTISIPMTSTVVSSGIGFVAPGHTDVSFGTFVLMSASMDVIIPPPPPPTAGTIPQSQMTATATSQATGYEAGKAIDGVTTTFWHTSFICTSGCMPAVPLPQSITLSLGGTYNVNKLRYLPRQDGNPNGAITAYIVYVSTDGVSFTPIANGSWAGTGSEKNVTFTPASAAFLRLEAVGGVNGYASASELNVEYATGTVGNNLVPSTTSQSPSSATSGGAGFALAVSGSNFIGGSVVRWNGSDRTTAFANSGSLTANITAADIADAGSASVTVFSPTPGGGTSNPQTFTINASIPPNPLAVAFLTSTTLGTIRNNYSGWIGMVIRIGSSPITVASLGRFTALGNNQSHMVKLVLASTGADVPDGSIAVNSQAAVPGVFAYSALTTPVVLSANTFYYVMSLESSGGDRWYDYNTIVTTTRDASVTSAVYGTAAPYSIPGGGTTNHEYAPVDFTYTVSGTPVVPPPSGTIPQSQLTATATSEAVGYEAGKAIDGNTAMFWHTSFTCNSDCMPSVPLPQSITLSLGGTYNVNKLRYLPRQDGNMNGAITTYQVLASTDGLNFTSIATGAWASDAGEKSVTFAPTSASYIRLEADAAVNGYASASEINLEY